MTPAVRRASFREPCGDIILNSIRTVAAETRAHADAETPERQGGPIERCGEVLIKEARLSAAVKC